MRLRLVALAGPLLALAACGDDGKQGSRGAPAAPPTPSPTGPSVPGPALPGPRIPDAPTPPAAAGTVVTPRVGDWVRFEVRATGVDAATSLRWTAVAVEASRVRLRVESGALDASGAVLSARTAEVWLSARTTEVWVPLPTLPETPGAPESVPVGGRSVSARPVTRGEFTAWYAAEVPLGGLVRSRGPGGVEQTAVDFGRGS